MKSRLMLVEDDQAARAMVRVAVRLNQLGQIVAETGKSADAARLADSTRPDVIVLDLYLADGGGRTVFHNIRLASPESRMVIYSAYEDERDWYEAQGAAFVGKSVDTDELVAALSRPA